MSLISITFRLFHKSVFWAADEVVLKFMNRCGSVHWIVSSHYKECFTLELSTVFNVLHTQINDIYL